MAFWRDTDLMKPADFVRAICSGIALQPLTAVVIESTANGVGKYFHKEWLRAKDGSSDKAAVFVGWHEIEENVADAGDVGQIVSQMDEYERNLWRRGLTLEQIRWYQLKRREAPDHSKVMAGIRPTTPKRLSTAVSECLLPIWWSVCARRVMIRWLWARSAAWL